MKCDSTLLATIGWSGKNVGKPMNLCDGNSEMPLRDDERAIRPPVKAFLDCKDPDSSGAAPWKSGRNTADICHKEIQ